jgi:hypothetical protein
MNEKMNKLWRQVKLQECDCGCNPDEFLRLKFAELIVKECIKAVDNSGGDNAEFHMDSIKKHFGVEE